MSFVVPLIFTIMAVFFNMLLCAMPDYIRCLPAVLAIITSIIYIEQKRNVKGFTFEIIALFFIAVCVILLFGEYIIYFFEFLANLL